MRRTLTAAAVLAGSAGALGFAGTATAAGAPEFPAELPVDNGVANTAFHAAGTLHSATRVVGDVVSAQEPRSNERSARTNPVDSIRDLGKEGSPGVTGLLPGNSDAEGLELKPGQSGGEGHVPGQPGQAGEPGTSNSTVNGKPAKFLPLDGTALADVPDAVSKLPGLVGETLPTEPLPGKAMPTAKTGGAPVGALPRPGQAKPASLVDRLGEVVSHGLLGGATNLGGS